MLLSSIKTRRALLFSPILIIANITACATKNDTEENFNINQLLKLKKYADDGSFLNEELYDNRSIANAFGNEVTSDSWEEKTAYTSFRIFRKTPYKENLTLFLSAIINLRKSSRKSTGIGITARPTSDSKGKSQLAAPNIIEIFGEPTEIINGYSSNPNLHTTTNTYGEPDIARKTNVWLTYKYEKPRANITWRFLTNQTSEITEIQIHIQEK